jgi:hypothetical protein
LLDYPAILINLWQQFVTFGAQSHRKKNLFVGHFRSAKEKPAPNVKMVLPTSVGDPKMPSTFICIYCTLSKPDDQRSKEHVLQRSLGGDLTVQFVCRDCNSGFSKIDQALSDRSTVTLSRVANTPSTAHRVKAGGITTFYEKDRDLFIEVDLRNQLTPVVLPQFHLRPDGKGEFIALDRAAAEQVIEFMNQNFTAGTMGSVHRFYGLPNGTPTNTAALVVRKPGDGYIRLPAAEDENWYLPMLKTAWEQNFVTGLANANAIPKAGKFPEVRLDITLAPNDVFRAIAKTAFNVLAFKRGQELMLRSEFDLIRKYIKGELVLPQDLGTDEIAIDKRFVDEILPDQQRIGFVDEGHAVVFCYLKPELIAFVTLYGSHLFLVRFPPLYYDEPEELFGHRFSIDRTGNNPIELIDIIERMLQKYPAQLGLTSEQAAKAVESLRPKESGRPNIPVR